MSLEVFDNVTEFPDVEFKKRFNQLVGLDKIKETIIKEAKILINPLLLSEWSKKHYGKEISLINYFKERPHLFIFSGDVGTGKTTLAETFGDILSREEDIPITLYRLSLKTRGSGAVGEMTRLISEAFNEVEGVGKKGLKVGAKPSSAYILLIDEADALAQSREFDQMHHEDKAGVNALIRGIDSVSVRNLPIIVLMCTNRLDAIDPAVRRRAAAIYEFYRPNDKQREFILKQILIDIGVSDEQVRRIVKITGRTKNRKYGFTYSDLIQRLVPAILLDSFPDKPVDFEKAFKVIKLMNPTPPFKEKNIYG